MKKIIATSLYLLTVHMLVAQVITVSNNARIPAQYTSLATAVTSANPGDTIYLYPSATNYASSEVIINKSLVIIGGWFNNKGSAFGGQQTRIDRLAVTGSASRVFIANCEISERLNIQNLSGSTNIFENITLVKNYIQQLNIYANNDNSFSSNGIEIRNNIIRSFRFQNWANTNGAQASINIENNIIGSVSNAGGDMIVIKNNFFIPRFAFSKFALNNITDAVIVNNIFYGAANFSGGIGAEELSGCLVDNNLSYETLDSFNPTQNNNNFFSNNITNENPLFTNFRSLNSYGFGSIISYNFQLSEASPAKNSGAQGTDIGISGGNFPFDQRARFSFPFTELIDLKNPVLSRDETLRFSVRATYPKD